MNTPFTPLTNPCYKYYNIFDQMIITWRRFINNQRQNEIGFNNIYRK
ncbi:Uncharacterized protein dnm_002500 [Desulfonema magnum]|uniref:Uncharacterized protein n=1 Tax=Desulfonema magnum TaxID=45655 RepID=A0A975BF34_9BACT|nr:Uncharacterized protein dnm_002500 [Desulfonema magnum]